MSLLTSSCWTSSVQLWSQLPPLKTPCQSFVLSRIFFLIYFHPLMERRFVWMCLCHANISVANHGWCFCNVIYATRIDTSIIYLNCNQIDRSTDSEVLRYIAKVLLYCNSFGIDYSCCFHSAVNCGYQEIQNRCWQIFPQTDIIKQFFKCYSPPGGRRSCRFTASFSVLSANCHDFLRKTVE